MRVGENLDEPGRFTHGLGATVGHERKHADAIAFARLFQRLFGLAHPGDLRLRVNDRRNGSVIHGRRVPGKAFGNHDALLHALVCQHGTTHHVTHGVHVGKIRAAMIVHMHETPFVEQQAGLGGKQSVGIGPSADRHDETIHAFLIFAVLVLVTHDYLVVSDPALQHPRPESNVESLGIELPERLARDLLVGHGEKTFLRLEQHHLAAQTAPYASQFEPDNTGTDHAETSRHFLKLQGALRIHDPLPIERRITEVHRCGAARKNDMIGSDLLRRIARYLHLVLRQQFSAARNPGHAVGPEQRGDAAREV